MKKQLYLFGLLFFPFFIQAQNVGIGTTTPTEKLEVKNPLRSTLKISSSHFNDTTQLVLSNRDPINQGTDFLITARREQGLFFTSASDLPGNTKDSLFSILVGGNAGIGTKSPAYRFQVHNNTSVNTFMNISNSATESGLNNGLLMGMTSNNAILSNLENGNLQLGTNNLTRVTIDAGGNVGIGTSVPANRFQLHDSGSVNTYMRITN